MATQVGVARWFTSARKVPQMIGRLHDGSRIWGGPYTFSQILSAMGCAALLWNTTWLWGGDSGVLNVGYTAMISVAVGWLAGRLPEDRNPILFAGGLLIAVLQPRWGRANGRRVDVPKIQTVRSRVVVQTLEVVEQDTLDLMVVEAAAEQPPIDITAVEPASSVPAISTGIPIPAPVVTIPEPPTAAVPVRHTGVETLLAAARSGGTK